MSGVGEKRKQNESKEDSTNDLLEKSEVNNNEINDDDNENEEDEDDSDEDIVNVDFDYFDIKEIDFQATKNLLRQLFDVDNVEFDLSGIADLIIKNALGTTIKTDGIDSDPFALLTVLNINANKDNSVIKSLADYFIQKTATNADFNRKLRQLFSTSSTSSVGLILQERLINMPTEVVPPMYKMLSEELTNQKDEFDYFLIVSKSFTEEESKLDQEEKRPSKKNRFQNKKEVYYFHPEDEIIHKHSLFKINYPFTKQSQESDSKRAFQDYGIYPQGHLILLKKDALSDLAKDLEESFPPF